MKNKFLECSIGPDPTSRGLQTSWPDPRVGPIRGHLWLGSRHSPGLSLERGFATRLL